MRADANLNGQDFHNLFVTPESMEFTELGNPIVNALDEVPETLETISFNYVTSKNPDYNKWVHFYIQDYLFSRVWNAPQKYMELLKQYPGVFAPDFSMFIDVPMPIQRYNHYRNLWCAAYWQANGIKVIPNVCWSTEESFSFCFDGMPKNSVVSVSAIGCMKNPSSRYLFFKGYEKALETLQPKLVLLRCAEQYQEEIISMTGPVQTLKYDQFTSYTK